MCKCGVRATEKSAVTVKPIGIVTTIGLILVQ